MNFSAKKLGSKNKLGKKENWQPKRGQPKERVGRRKKMSSLLTEENVAVHKFGTQNLAAHKIWLPTKLGGQKKFAVQNFGSSN